MLIVAEPLQVSWSRPVTYEEPRWRHASDVSLEGDPLQLNYGPRMRTVRLPAGALAARTRDQQRSVLQGIIDSFNRVNVPLQYSVVESEWGWHFVPTRDKDSSGVAAPVSNLLDLVVEIPSSMRSRSAQVEAVVASLRKAAGIQLESAVAGQRLYFHRPATFLWGTSGRMSGREALLSLLGSRPNQRGWRLNCMPAMPAGSSELCALNLDVSDRANPFPATPTQIVLK